MEEAGDRTVSTPGECQRGVLGGARGFGRTISHIITRVFLTKSSGEEQEIRIAGRVVCPQLWERGDLNA